jgi:hypothetical protein
VRRRPQSHHLRPQKDRVAVFVVGNVVKSGLNGHNSMLKGELP